MKWNFACKPVRQLWNIISLTFRPFAFQANIKQRLPPLLNVALCLGQRKDQIYFAGYAVWSVASRLKVTFSFHLNCRCPLYSFHSSRVWRCSLTKKATRMWREKEKETAWERERELVHSSENWPSRFELMRPKGDSPCAAVQTLRLALGADSVVCWPNCLERTKLERKEKHSSVFITFPDEPGREGGGGLAIQKEVAPKKMALLQSTLTLLLFTSLACFVIM